MDQPLPPSPHDSARLADLANRFEEAWLRGERPRLEDWLREAGGCRAVLVELVHMDLEYRLRAGEIVTVAEYLRAHPELLDDRETLLGLLQAEEALRQGAGQANPSPSAGRLGKFELLEPVGSGRFGTVYRARDTALGRLVAVKVQRRHRPAGGTEQERFLREARSAGRLDHPGIVRVLEAGRTEDGVCYLVTEWVAGQDLRHRLAAGRLDPRASAELTARVADAVQHAHERGLVHRDIKPSNILLDADGRPRLTDFGLARGGEGDATLTADGEVLGTPAYMPPEQARGESRRVNGRGDVYSLGVVLYEMLTGELPFQGDVFTVLPRLLEGNPRPPRQLDRRIPADLEAVCLQAMAVEPSRRYQSAAELAVDLRRFLAGEPVRARPAGPVRRLWRKCRRRPVLSALSLALVLVTLGGLALVA